MPRSQRSVSGNADAPVDVAAPSPALERQAPTAFLKLLYAAGEPAIGEVFRLILPTQITPQAAYGHSFLPRTLNSIYPMPSYSTPFNIVVEHFGNMGVTFRSDEEQKLVFFTMCGETAIYVCRLRVTHEDTMLQINLQIPILVREAKLRAQVAELVTRANYGLTTGRFDLDPSDGQISFHIGHRIHPAGLDEETVSHLFAVAVITANSYFPALMRLLYGGHTPEDAVFLSELEAHSDGVASDGGSHHNDAPRPIEPRACRTVGAPEPSLDKVATRSGLRQCWEAFCRLRGWLFHHEEREIDQGNAKRV